MSIVETATVRPWRAARLWVEFATLFIALPLIMAFFIPPDAFFTMLVLIAATGLMLLAITPGWRWRRLLEARPWRDLGLFVGFALVMGASVFALAWWLVPSRFMDLPLYRTELWLMIMMFYPFFSALPQELLYRALFFERYGALFGRTMIWPAIILNAACFSLAHLFFWNWPAVLLTFVGGVFFAYAYVRLRSFPLAFLLHAVAGQAIFTSGLGRYFYHGAIPGG
jgi:membrane protease YdiL (CAAX protease family)